MTPVSEGNCISHAENERIETPMKTITISMLLVTLAMGCGG